MSRDAALEAYFQEAASWDADRAAQAMRSRRTAWWVAGAGWICAVTVSCALMLLMPLKRVEPFVIRVAEDTGRMDVVPVYAGSSEFPETVARYFLSHYVTVCERFNFGTAESDYEECGAFHTAQRNQQWFAAWTQSNPASPLNVYKDGTSVRAEVVSISFFTRANGIQDLAQVRYTRERRRGDGAAGERTHHIASIQYTFAEAPKDPKTRRWNPLGFRVLEFKSEPEVLAEAKEIATAPNEATSVGAVP